MVAAGGVEPLDTRWFKASGPEPSASRQQKWLGVKESNLPCPGQSRKPYRLANPQREWWCAQVESNHLVSTYQIDAVTVWLCAQMAARAGFEPEHRMVHAAGVEPASPG